MVVIYIILALAVGIFVGRWSLRALNRNAEFEVPSRKDEKTILELFKVKDQIQNKDVRDALGVSDATAVRYLDVLEQKGVITQQGTTGRNTFYTKN